jgi:hypothetical protein
LRGPRRGDVLVITRAVGDIVADVELDVFADGS